MDEWGVKEKKNVERVPYYTEAIEILKRRHIDYASYADLADVIRQHFHKPKEE